MAFLFELVRFGFVGGAAATADFGSYVTLTRFFELRPYYVAVSIVTSFIGASVAYVLNHRWTFRHPSALSAGRYGKFLSVYGLGIVWQNLLLFLFVHFVGFHDVAAKIIAILLVAAGWNFVLAKWWVFKYTGKES